MTVSWIIAFGVSALFVFIARKRFHCLHENSTSLEGKMFKHSSGHVLESQKIIQRLFALCWFIFGAQVSGFRQMEGFLDDGHDTSWQSNQLNKQEKEKRVQSQRCVYENVRTLCGLWLKNKKKSFASSSTWNKFQLFIFHCTAENVKKWL